MLQAFKLIISFVLLLLLALALAFINGEKGLPAEILLAVATAALPCIAYIGLDRWKEAYLYRKERDFLTGFSQGMLDYIESFDDCIQCLGDMTKDIKVATKRERKLSKDERLLMIDSVKQEMHKCSDELSRRIGKFKNVMATLKIHFITASALEMTGDFCLNKQEIKKHNENLEDFKEIQRLLRSKGKSTFSFSEIAKLIKCIEDRAPNLRNMVGPRKKGAKRFNFVS